MVRQVVFRHFAIIRQKLTLNVTTAGRAGDGVCDSWANHESCAYDGGDCCLDTCQYEHCDGAVNSTCFDPLSDYSLCGSLGPDNPDYARYRLLCWCETRDNNLPYGISQLT